MPDDLQEPKYRFDPILSAHPSFCQTDYVNDQSWQICLDRKYVSGIVLETSFGLQARIAQVYPVFLDATNLPIKEPHPIFILQTQLPELARYRVVLFPDMDVTLTLRVPNSHTLTGEVELVNQSSTEKKINLGVLLRFSGHETGQDPHPGSQNDHTYLAAQADNLAPVLLTSGMPILIHQPHPGLALNLLVVKGHPVRFRWVLATRQTISASLSDAADSLKEHWQAGYRKSALVHSTGLVDIRSGRPELDQVLRRSQLEMSRLRMSSTDKTPYHGAVAVRGPDDGYSSRSDGSDYSPDRWGLSSWGLRYAVSNLLLPGQVETAAGLFHNFIQLQQGFGDIDQRPGLNGQRTHLLAAPLLAGCALEIAKSTGNLRRLAEAYPILNYHLQKWQDPDHDRDQDHIPEWQHPSQTGWADNPLWNAWQIDGKGYAVETLESPALGSMLYHEMKAIQAIAALLNKPSDTENFDRAADGLRTAVNRFWDKRRKFFRYQDRDTHVSPSGKNITKARGAGSFPINRVFETATRLNLLITTRQDITRPITIDLIGLNQTGQHTVESIPQAGIIWRDNRCTLTSRQVFSRLESIQITGLAPKDEWQISELDLSQNDLTLFLPLWAGIPSQADAETLVRQTLFTNWLEDASQPLCMFPPGKSPTGIDEMHLPWNALLIDGLLRYGFIAEADQLVNQMMEVIINLTSDHGTFYEIIQPGHRRGSGQRNHLLGLAPVGLYLRAQGIHIRSAGSIEVQGRSKYDRELDVLFQGTTIHRDDRRTVVRFADEQQVTLAAEESKIIHWKTAGGG